MVEVSVHECHCAFVFEVTSDSKSSYNSFCAGLSCEIDGESVEGYDFDVVSAGDGFLEHSDSFFDVEGNAFVVAVVDGDDEGVEQCRGSPDHVGVAVGYGVERSWVEGYDVAHRCVSWSFWVAVWLVNA